MSELLKLFSSLLLILMAINSYAIENIAIKIKPAWEGNLQTENTTELGVQITAPQGGEIKLTIKGGNLTTHHIAALEADIPLKLWLPVHPLPNRPLTLEIYQEKKLIFHQQINFISNQQGLIAATIKASPTATTQQHRKHITVTADTLPRTNQGYGSIQSLVLTTADLGSLNEAQTLALSSYLQACNELLLVDAHNDILNQLRKIAGCNGQTVHYYQNKPENKPLRSSLSFRALQALPQKGGRHNPIVTLSLFFSFYLCILLLVLHIAKKPAPLLAIPPLSIIILIAAWSLQENQANVTSWSEMESGAQQANFSALLNIDGVSTEQYNLQLSRKLGLPKQKSDIKVTNLEFSHRLPFTEQLTITTQPFSHDQFLFQGSLSIPYKILLSTDSVTPTIINHGDKLTTGAILSWRGKIHAVPPLTPGKPWSPTGEDTIEISSALISIIKARAGTDDTALILPYTLQEAGLFPSHVQESGWLLVRPAT